MSHSDSNPCRSSVYPPARGLYDPAWEHDACGVGFIANLHGEASHAILEGALTALHNLAHRGAIDADAVTGDGAGVLTQIPYGLLLPFLAEQGIRLGGPGELAVAMVFLPRRAAEMEKGRGLFEAALARESLELLAWRKVPVDHSCLGRKADSTRPAILQALIHRPPGTERADFDRRLLLAQKFCTREAEAAGMNGFYVVSMSAETVTYKGLFNAPQVRQFYLDLRSSAYETAFAVFHQRFATNTFPDWNRAQPFRLLAHNGEINTIRGNRVNMAAREFSADQGVWGDRYRDLAPMVQPGMSDSASFDNCLQLVKVGGRSVLDGVAMMMPTAWEEDREMPAKIRDYYKYHAIMMEPWDGPAAVVFADGRYVGASLDRNGLRPARYKVYGDGTVILASEVGLIPRWDSEVVRCGRLGPGRMMVLDLVEHRLFEDEEIKARLADGADYSGWCARSIQRLAKTAPSPDVSLPATPAGEVTALRVAFGYDLEEEKMILRPMAETGKEPIGSMGEDTPLAVLSRRPRLLYAYFKQLFAQVTNPPIDSLRERLVMSLKMHLGGRLSLFDEMKREHHFIALESPLLLDHEFAQLFSYDFLRERIAWIDLRFPVAEGPAGLRPALARLRAEVRAAARDGGCRLIVLSDRGVDATRAAVPALLAVGAAQSELVALGLRIQCDLVIETGEARDVHQIACLLGFGANAVYPYFAYDVLRRIVSQPAAGDDAGDLPQVGAEEALRNYRQAIDAGLLKIMSKMGISTLFSYQGAKVFEAIGIGPEVIGELFAGTPSPIGGIGYEEIGVDVLRRHADAFPREGAPELWSEGFLKPNKKGGEFHAWSPRFVSGMNTFIRKGGGFTAFREMREAADVHVPTALKDLLRLRFGQRPGVPLAEVESVEEIRRRFTTAAMSLGALSPEMHETLAIAMNRIGGKSNSGEGGEDPRRFRPYPNGDYANSAIKQVASGRFGVTAEYLTNAREIEIKIAQGAKPGEGGQLMGWKVSPLIARLRFSVPGVTLISPPPHHDIYSIEDLAQLIFDLKEVNPRAKVCVKLVACSGVGTVAAGVAKAYADVILISGHDGGTGASPFSSVKHAGSAWEIGLSEAHQVLMLNGLRSRVTLRTDGGMKSGRDIVVAALLGAEEYNFGTAALIAGGCAMFRVCHLNTCPVGVATQREDLRAKFRGKPEYIVNYFNAVAQDVRVYLSKLGFRTLNELVGRTDFLEPMTDPRNPKTARLDFSRLLHAVDPSWEQARVAMRARNERIGNMGSLDDSIIQDAKETITHREPVFRRACKVLNVDRNVGTKLSGEIAYLHGNDGLKPGTISIECRGSAGQGFGTFLVRGVRLTLIGDANDYVGKGMSGGEVVVRPKEEASFAWHRNVIMGNTCLYGATGGVLFGAGQAGERFAVRNSGAVAVIEGVGDHACEYMTGGTIVCLGRTGRNFGAGMSGGLALVYDEFEELPARFNPEMVVLERPDNPEEIEALERLVELHGRLTGSPRSAMLLRDWPAALARFYRVSPKSSPEAAKASFVFDPSFQAITV
jgi:glutamate synthase (ferredoxin)